MRSFPKHPHVKFPYKKYIDQSINTVRYDSRKREGDRVRKQTANRCYDDESSEGSNEEEIGPSYVGKKYDDKTRRIKKNKKKGTGVPDDVVMSLTEFKLRAKKFVQ